MIRVAGLLLVVTILVPGAGLSSHEIHVDVRVTGSQERGSESWIEFSPDRSAYVAVYATFSDGTLVPVFPGEARTSHWVEGCEIRVAKIRVPWGVSLDSVHAVAASEWFDPRQCWVAQAPRIDGSRAPGGADGRPSGASRA